MNEDQEPQEEPTEEEEEEKEPIGIGGGIPMPKRSRKYGRIPGLTRRQTYHIIVAIPVIQLGLSFILFLISLADFYKIPYPYFAQITGFSLVTNLYYWYSAKFMGSCISALVSIYTMIALSIVNIIYLIFDFNYLLYGMILTGVGLFVAIAVLRR